MRERSTESREAGTVAAPWWSSTARELPCLAIYAASAYYVLAHVVSALERNTQALTALLERVGH